MGALRIDRTEDDWRNNGEKLLNRIRPKRKLHTQIKKLLLELDKENNNTALTISKLNSYKDVLGEDWIKWVKTITQHNKDKERTKFYVSNSVYDHVIKFSENSDYSGNTTKCLEQLFIALNELGVNNIGDIYNLQEITKSFEDVTVALNNSTPISSTCPSQSPTLSLIIKSIITELNKNKIRDFRSLSAIRKKGNEVDKLELKIRKEKADLDDELKNLRLSINRMQNILAEKNNEISEIKKQLNNSTRYKENNSGSTKAKLKHPKPVPKISLSEIKGRSKTNKR